MDIIAGILLLIGNIVFAKGYTFESLYIFLLVNIFFLLNSLFLNNIIGSIFIGLGILAQVYTIIQMIKGNYMKSIDKNK